MLCYSWPKFPVPPSSDEIYFQVLCCCALVQDDRRANFPVWVQYDHWAPYLPIRLPTRSPGKNVAPSWLDGLVDRRPGGFHFGELVVTTDEASRNATVQTKAPVKTCAM